MIYVHINRSIFKAIEYNIMCLVLDNTMIGILQNYNKNTFLLLNVQEIRMVEFLRYIVRRVVNFGMYK